MIQPTSRDRLPEADVALRHVFFDAPRSITPSGPSPSKRARTSSSTTATRIPVSVRKPAPIAIFHDVVPDPPSSAMRPKPARPISLAADPRRSTIAARPPPMPLTPKRTPGVASPRRKPVAPIDLALANRENVGPIRTRSPVRARTPVAARSPSPVKQLRTVEAPSPLKHAFGFDRASTSCGLC